MKQKNHNESNQWLLRQKKGKKNFKLRKRHARKFGYFWQQTGIAEL